MRTILICFSCLPVLRASSESEQLHVNPRGLAGWECIAILLLQPPRYWPYRYEPPWPVRPLIFSKAVPPGWSSIPSSTVFTQIMAEKLCATRTWKTKEKALNLRGPHCCLSPFWLNTLLCRGPACWMVDRAQARRPPKPDHDSQLKLTELGNQDCLVCFWNKKRICSIAWKRGINKNCSSEYKNNLNMYHCSSATSNPNLVQNWCSSKEMCWDAQSPETKPMKGSFAQVPIGQGKGGDGLFSSLLIRAIFLEIGRGRGGEWSRVGGRWREGESELQHGSHLVFIHRVLSSILEFPSCFYVCWYHLSSWAFLFPNTVFIKQSPQAGVLYP